MTTIDHVRGCDPRSMLAFAARLMSNDDTFAAAVEQMNRSVDNAMDHWEGDAAASVSVRKMSNKLAANHLSETIVTLADHFTTRGVELDNYRTALIRILDVELPPKGMAVDPLGNVTPPKVPGNDVTAAALQQNLDSDAAGFQTRIKTLLTQFIDTENLAANAISDDLQLLGNYEKTPDVAIRPEIQRYVDDPRQLPTDPKQLRELWETLTPAEKDALFQHDQYLGNRDGLPVADRDHYNRLKLQDELARAEAGDPAVKGKLDDLRTIAAGVNGPDRYLMLLDTQTGRNAHTAIAIGNPDAADHVSTYVPGTGSKPAKMGGDMLRCQRMRDAAMISGAGNPAVVAWFGYDAPPDPVNLGQQLNPFDNDPDDASNVKYADAGAASLDRFQDGLRATHNGIPSYNSIVAHSYGTTLTGDAAAHGRTLNADSVALVASPGTTVDHASDFHLTGVPQDQVAKRIFATQAENDAIDIAVALEPYGADPMTSEFGAQTFASDPGHATPVVDYSLDAHSQYWDINNGKPCKSLVNLGDIIAGRNPSMK
ncbi:hypothetical protein D5S18_11850 [Nocardia panacis]|uniref:DUF1023 domain-containing protein n=1 Tax=Nocardia panacis TaxID=2340916 RepID=A0A3A4L3J0_9NOCA|nr:alpha/beta hydrolase [Nocardia panacis]RJO76903.1 hypothetical protein D5S18_11850 [Nocardia panacis]